MNQFEARKRALVAECEVYRETLKLELHNFRLYALRTKRKFSGFGTPHPLMLLAGPLLGALLRRRRGSLLRRMVMAVVSWQVSQRLRPFLAGFFSSSRPPGRAEAPASDRGAMRS